jgi:hypothetical protein
MHGDVPRGYSGDMVRWQSRWHRPSTRCVVVQTRNNRIICQKAVVEGVIRLITQG